MAKIIKTRIKQKLNLPRLVFMFFIFSIFLSLASSIFLRSYNQNLTKTVQKKEYEIKRINIESDLIKVDIQLLESQERIFKVAEANKMIINQDNVVLVRE